MTEFVSAAAGDTLSFEWYHDSRGDDIIDDSHKGPIITYIASYTDSDGTGAIWSKIDEEGYDSSSQLWAVDNLISNSGKKDFTVPSSLAAGQYLVRQEIIALHEANVLYTDDSSRGAQFYPSCVQIEITGSGSASPDEDYDINDGYSSDSTGILFNIYDEFDSYPIPGPELWDGSGSGSTSASNDTIAAPASTSSTAAAASSTAAASTSAAAPSSSAVGGGSCKRKLAKRAR